MRLLSLGCHDGFIEHWLCQELPDLEVCGVELNSHAVEGACKRGIDCKRGMAEDATRLFDPGSFDAVAAYELIEHVPSVEDLLNVCEQMVKPGGLIYVSTPDGTFGEGGNPHHLRAYRSVELADLLRRRGSLKAFAVGGDGISIASYTPEAKRGEVAIFTGPGVPWHPMDIETKGLGGSETAAYRLAEGLATLGYVVTLYGQFEQEGAMGNVLLRDWQTFDPTMRRLAVVSSRTPELFDRPVNAEHKLLWCHDTDYGDRVTEARMRKVDVVLGLSGWHVEHLKAMYPFLDGKVRKVRNGITPGYYRSQDGLEREKRVVYTSSPDRGLDILLDIWPRVLEHVPAAKLTCCYPGYFDIAADQDAKLGAFRDKIKKQIDELPGVTSAGSLSLPSLATLLRSSMVWAHPSYCTPHNQKFYETSCISAMEAQACGCHVVAGEWGALPETVSIGELVEGDPSSDDWRDRFAYAIMQGLTCERLQTIAQVAGPEEIKNLEWSGVADLFADLIEPSEARPFTTAEHGLEGVV